MAKYDDEKLYIVIDEGPKSIFEDEVEKRLKNGYLQPALHFIQNTYGQNLVGMIRFGYNLNWNAHKSQSTF